MSDKLLPLFNMFIDKEIDVVELQNRIATIQCENYYEIEQIKSLDNHLEEIIYCYNSENQYKIVVQILNKIMYDE